MKLLLKQRRHQVVEGSNPFRSVSYYKMEETGFNIAEHILVPEHIKLSDEEKQKVLEQFNISVIQLPKIYTSDPALQDMDVKEGDVIRVKRISPTKGEADFYRVVVNG